MLFSFQTVDKSISFLFTKSVDWCFCYFCIIKDMKTYVPTAKWTTFSDSLQQKQSAYTPDCFPSLDT